MSPLKLSSFASPLMREALISCSLLIWLVARQKKTEQRMIVMEITTTFLIFSQFQRIFFGITVSSQSFFVRRLSYPPAAGPFPYFKHSPECLLFFFFSITESSFFPVFLNHHNGNFAFCAWSNILSFLMLFLVRIGY